MEKRTSAAKKILGVCSFVSFIMINLSGCMGENSGESGIINHLTGAQQVKTYSKAKTQIQDINKTLEKRYQEI